MAVADYYQRAALAASQVIAGFDEGLFRRTLEGTAVGVGVSRGAAETSEGNALADLTVRLLARLYSALELRIDHEAEGERLATLARAINPQIELTTTARIGIGIGEDTPAFETTFFAGSSGWDALLSRQEAVPTGSSHNPFGPGAAACLAAADLFKRVLLPDWSQRMTGDARFSTFYREKQATGQTVPNQDWTLVGDAVLVGLGAIGNGALWALGRAPLVGRLHLVDPEAIELSNLQRYVLSVRSDEHRAKTDIARSYQLGPLDVVPHEQSWSDFLGELGHYHRHVLVALDSAADRRSVQGALPEWIANAWTQPGDLGISIHGPFGGEGACLSCLYLPTSRSQNEDEIIAQALGVPDLVVDVRTLLHTGAGVSRTLLAAMAGPLGRPLEDLLAYEGRPIRTLYVEGICGGGLIPLGTTGVPRQELHVPFAHQSALAGVILAAGLVRRAVGGSDPTTVVTRINPLAPLADYVTQPILRAGQGLCICEDPDYLRVFETKYARSGA
jgi:hypothetical protein